MALERDAASEAAMVSGERKEDLLQSAHRAVRAHAKLIQGSGAAHAALAYVVQGRLRSRRSPSPVAAGSTVSGQPSPGAPVALVYRASGLSRRSWIGLKTGRGVW